MEFANFKTKRRDVSWNAFKKINKTRSIRL